MGQVLGQVQRALWCPFLISDGDIEARSEDRRPIVNTPMTCCPRYAHSQAGPKSTDEPTVPNTVPDHQDVPCDKAHHAKNPWAGPKIMAGQVA